MDESNDMHNAVKNNARQTVIDNNNNNSSDNNATNNNDGHNDEEVMKHQHIINHISLQPTILIVDAAKGGISPIRIGSRSSSNSRSSPTNSVEDGLTKPLFLAVIALVFGSSVQFGFQLACINSPRHLIEKFIEETSFAEDRERFEEMRAWIWSSIVAAFPLGAIFGCLIAATLSDTYGRKTTIFFNNIPATIAGVLMTFAYPFKIWYLLLIGRLVIGVSAGISSGVLSTFLTELAPVRLRGTLGGSNQLLITAAMLFSNILSFSALFGTETRWPYIFVFTFFPIIAQLILLRYCPESPRYTLIFGKNESQSEKDLRMLRGRSDVRAEIEAIQKEAREKEKEPKITFATLFTRELRWSTLIAIFLMFMQQMSGINAAMYYSNDIFKSTGLIGDQIILATCAIMLTNVLMTLASEWLVDHPLFGRRFLLLTGMLGMFLMSIGIVASLILISMKDHINEGRILAIVFMVMYVFAFAIGPGPIPWFYVGELFPSYSRASGTSIACAVNLMTNFWVGLLFPPIREHLTHYTFLIFTVALFFGTIITMFFIPETKGKTIEEIQQHLKKKRPSCI